MTRSIYGALTAGLLTLALAGCGGGDDSGGGGGDATPAPASSAGGEQLFAQRCGSCHTLAAAGTTGQIGPNLDDLKPDAAQVRHAIETAPGVMPEKLASGQDAQRIAQYVAGAAGG